MHAIFFNEPIETSFLGHQMAEIYRDRVYFPFLTGKKNLTIVDIGANVGLTSYYFSQFASKVYALEPSLQHFDILTRMITFNHLEDKIVPIQKAIWMEKKTLPFGGPANNKTMRSLHMATWQDGKSDEVVECVSFEDLFNDLGLKEVDFVKLDVEGSEYEILSSPAFKMIAPKIGTMVIERHQWTDRNPNQINEALKMVGFTVNQIPNNADLVSATR